MGEILPGEKKCNVCNQIKPLSELVKEKGFKDGYRPLCKECKKKKTESIVNKWAEERQNKKILIKEKKCKDCNQIKTISEFVRDKYHKDGRSNVCKECKKQRQNKLKEKWKRNRNQNNYLVEEKKCNSCGHLYPRTQFTILSNSKDGLSHICKSCEAERRKKKKLLWKIERSTKEQITHKICPSCNRDLPVSAYYKMEGWKDGVSFYCKICSLQKQKVYAKKWEEERKEGKNIIHQKECILCHRFLPTNRFYKNRSWKDGYNGVCIACERNRQQRYIKLWEKERTISSESPTEKKCILCNRVLPAEFFNSTKRRKDGLSSACKECFSKRQNAYIIKWAEEHQNKKENAFSLYPEFEKICNKCKKTLPKSQFYKKARSKDGLSSNCIECEKKIAKQTRIRYFKSGKWKENLKNIPKEKECKRCHKVLPSSQFDKNKERKDGLSRLCKNCKRIKNKEYRSNPENLEKLLKYKREYNSRPEVKKRQRKRRRKYEKLPHVKKKRKAYMKEYMSRPEVIERKKQYRKEYNQRPEVKERIKKYYKEYHKKKKQKSLS